MTRLSSLALRGMALLLMWTLLSVPTFAQKGDFTVGNQTFLLNGKPFVVKAAELHYPRIPRPYWKHRIQMCKALGMNTICLYVFWNIHEQQEGVFDFDGNNDVAAFCRLAQEEGMYVIVRPGPYVCAEWEMGGLPWWLLRKTDIRLREDDPYFMERVDKFEERVAQQLALSPFSAVVQSSWCRWRTNMAHTAKASPTWHKFATFCANIGGNLTNKVASEVAKPMRR